MLTCFKMLCKILEVVFLSVGSSNSSCGSELSLCQKWALAKAICWDFLFISNPRLLFPKQLHALGSALRAPCQAFRAAQTPSNTSGWFPTKWVLQWHKSMIKIFSKCVKENNLLLLSPSGGNCCLGGLSCALRLEVPALSTESGLEHLSPCAYRFFSLFFPSSSQFFHTGSSLPSFHKQSDQNLTWLYWKKKRKKNIPKSTNHPQLFFFSLFVLFCVLRKI